MKGSQHTFMKSQWAWAIVVGIFAISIIFMWYNLAVFENLEEKLSFDKNCQWKDGDPVIYGLKTKLGVNYDAGHWFHIAENFMTQHSALRSKWQLANSSVVCYSFDKSGFSKNLNGVTRLLIYLGTKSSGTSTSSLNFIDLPSQIDGKPGDILSIHTSKLLSTQSIDLTKEVAMQNRFLLSPTAQSGSKLSGVSVCMKFMGNIGGNWPTPQRGHWYPNDGDIETFRQKIRDACPPDLAYLQQHRKQKAFKLVVYQRDMSRKLANEEEEAMAMLRRQLGEDKWEFQVLMHSSKRSPCELAHILHDADVLVTPHGFQSMLLLFLPRPALLFEVFPYKYYKRGYGPFGAEYGVVLSGAMSPATLWHTELFLSFVTTDWCMQSKFCRGYARNQDVRLTQHGGNKLASFIDSNLGKIGEANKKNRDFLYEL